MKIKYIRQDNDFVVVPESDNNYDCEVSIDDIGLNQQLHITHQLEIRTNDQDTIGQTFCIGNWTFRNDSLFCFDSEEEQCRIDIQANCAEYDAFYDFYIIKPYLKGNLFDIAAVFMEMISVITNCTSVQDFDRVSSNTSVSRIF